jgi:hypothetical protein
MVIRHCNLWFNAKYYLVLITMYEKIKGFIELPPALAGG